MMVTEWYYVDINYARGQPPPMLTLAVYVKLKFFTT